jgi:hypothetical protein
MAVVIVSSRRSAGLVWLIVTMWVAMHQAVESKQLERYPTKDAALAQEYLFAACVIKNYPGSPLAEEADIWAGGLVEQGSVPADVYAKLADIAKKDSPEPAQSKAGNTMRMQSCLALYNSPAAKAKVRQLLRQ